MITLFKWIVICFFFIMHSAGTGDAASSDSQSLFGQMFVVFPSQGPWPAPQYELLVISSHGSPLIRVQLMSSWYSRSYLVSHSGEITVDLRGQFRSPQTANQTSALRVTSDKDIIVMIFYQNVELGLATILFPVEWAGSLYMFPVQKLRFFAVAALNEVTDIKIYFKSATPTNNTKTERLESFEMYVSQSEYPAPHLVVSSKPVLVYCGYSMSNATGMASNSTPHQAYYNEYLLPLDQWSNTYIGMGFNGTITITTPVPNVEVNISRCNTSNVGQESVTISNAGGFLEVNMEMNCPVLVSASDPVYVTQFASSGLGKDLDALYYVVPVEKFLSSYTFEGSNTVSQITVYVIIKESSSYGISVLGDIILTSKKVTKQGAVSDYSVYFSSIKSTGTFTVYHQQEHKFGIYVKVISPTAKFWAVIDIGYTRQRALCLKNISEPGAGDLIDNDCDRRTDEETTRLTTVLFSPRAVHGQWGPWYPWHCRSACDLTEVRRRLRVCNSPAPSDGGNGCSGRNYELGDRCVTKTMCLLECPAGTWGTNCSLQCPEHCHLGRCDVNTGVCEENSCAQGYRGHFCNVSCARNTYGIGCLRFCTKRCVDPGCDRFTGDCETEPLSFQTLVVVGPVYIAVALSILMAIPKLRKLPDPKRLLFRLSRRSAMLERQNRELFPPHHVQVHSTDDSYIAGSDVTSEWQGSDTGTEDTRTTVRFSVRSARTSTGTSEKEDQRFSVETTRTTQLSLNNVV